MPIQTIEDLGQNSAAMIHLATMWHLLILRNQIDDTPFLLLPIDSLRLTDSKNHLSQTAVQGTPYEYTLSTAFEKLTAMLTDEVSFDPVNLPASISFRANGVASVDAKEFHAASKAVLDCEEITFDYQKLQTAHPELRQVQPYHLVCVHGLWYLIGHDLERGAMRTFALPRIRNLTGTGNHFVRDPAFSPDRYFGGSLGILRGEGDMVVRIAFDAFAATLVRERFWHHSQVIIEKAGGELELELSLSHLDEAKCWVLSWGEHARVLSPKSLASRVRETALKVSAFAD